MTDGDPNPVQRAVTSDLNRWGADVAQSGLGAQALDLARHLDAPKTSPTAAALLHAQLRQVLLDLAKLAPAPAVRDGVSDLAAEREQRRKAAGMP